MKPRTSLSFAAAFFLLAGCATPTEKSSTFEDSPASSPGATTTTESPTEPAAKETDSVSIKVPDACSIGAKTAAGCEVTYDIDVTAAAATLPKTCAEGYTAYNDCTGAPIELTWKDLGYKHPKSAKVEIGVSIFCADPLLDATVPQHQGVSINGGTIGGFVGDVTACSCAAVTTSHSYDVAPSFLDNYATGGDNKITIQGPNRCIGVGGLDGTHTVARIVVTY